MIEVSIPAKIATWRENNRPTVSVTTKVTASDPVALETVLICRSLMSEAPINTTKVAREQSGTKEIKFPRNPDTNMIKQPAIKFAKLVLAPD